MPTAAAKARTNTKLKTTAEDKNPQLTDVKDEKTGKNLTVQQLKNKLRNEAEREVLDAHKDEVTERTGAKYKAHGLEYVRRLSDAEKAQKAIEEHLDQYPELEAIIAARLAKAQTEQQQAQVEAEPSGLKVPMSAWGGGQQGADERGVPPFSEKYGDQ